MNNACSCYISAVFDHVVLHALLVMCINFIFSGYGDLRIRGRTNTGILEIQIGDGYWGTVCSNGFDHNAATVACRQLGYRNLAYG